MRTSIGLMLGNGKYVRDLIEGDSILVNGYQNPLIIVTISKVINSATKKYRLIEYLEGKDCDFLPENLFLPTYKEIQRSFLYNQFYIFPRSFQVGKF